MKTEIHTPASDPGADMVPEVGEVKAGFPVMSDPTGDTTPLDLNKLVIKNPASTFYLRVSGESMSGDGISDGDLLVVDRSVEPYDNCIAVCMLDGEFTLKRVELHEDHALLIPSNARYKPIRVTAENQFAVWGVVRYVIKKL